jgi:hypothetical protein
MRTWDFIFNALNLSLAPHYGYGGTFIVLPLLVMIFFNRRIFLKITFVFSLVAVTASAAELLLASTGRDAEQERKSVSSDDPDKTHGTSVASEASSAPSGQKLSINAPGTSKKRLNVYHIIVDEYARADQLKSVLNFDNSAFINELEERGYDVITRARSNYPYTAFSLSSIFSMNYPYTESSPFSDFKKTYSIVGSINPVIHRVWELGYQYAHIGSSMWGGTQCSDHPRVICLTPRKAIISNRTIEILDAVNRMTPLSYFISVNAQVGGITSVDDVRETMTPMPVSSPFVLFAHTLSPHVPYTTRADCSDQPTIQFYLSGGLDPKKYLEALQCVNKRLLAFADFIAESDPNAIVVFHSDHGSKFLLEETLPLDAWTKKQFDERFSIFFAIKAPEGCTSRLPPDLSLVNLYRFIFSCVEGTAAEYLENRFYNINYDVSKKGATNFGRVHRFQTKDR